jgi:predicted alpha-1,2-mannosidase
MRAALLAAVTLLAIGTAPAAAADPDLARHVEPRIGTVPPGFTFPGAAVPFGMVQNSPDTPNPFAYGGYLATDPVIRGFSLVHLSGPGVPKAGDLPFMPTVGPAMSNDPNVYASAYDHASEQAEAGYYRVLLEQAATEVELTAATRAAMQRYTFPPTPHANVVIDVTRSTEGVHEGAFSVTGPDEVSGWTRGRYPVFFVARFSRPFSEHGTFAAEGKGAGGWVRFDTTTERQVTMRVGVSFVDTDGARRNLEADAPDFDFDQMRKAARAAWNAQLGRIEVTGGTDGERTSFYTALYHAFLHPNVFTDADGRYRGFDDQPHVAEGRTQYANFSSWDLYKSSNQLLSLLEPDRYRDMLRSLLDDHRLGGKLPRWGEQSIDAAHMSGDPAVPMIVDGFCRGVVDRSTAEELYAAAVHLQSRRPAELGQHGYLPMKPGTTLEYGIADFSLALMADGLGLRDDAERWLAQSLRYRNILDPETRFVRPREADGSWHSPFDPTEETGFQEGNSWQYSWLLPHDARGLYDRFGGDGVALERLGQLFSLPPEAQTALTLFGLRYRDPQWAPSNEHDLQIPWMFAFAGEPARGARVLRDIQRLYRPTPDGLPGNDDLGGLSAWHVFNALGFGPVTPGAPFYVLGSPQFERVAIRPAGGGEIVVTAPGTSTERRYVRSARLNGRALDRAWFEEELVRPGGTLELEMGSEPDPAWATQRSAVPPSVSDAPLTRFGCRPGAAAATAGDGAAARRARPRLRLSVTPARVVAGQRRRFRFRLTVRDAGGVRPASGRPIRFAGRTLETRANGTATAMRRLRAPGRRRAIARVAGAGRASATVRVVARRRPRFAG